MRALVAIGTRPEGIKMAPVVRALLSRPECFETRVCLTAQHRELLDQVVAAFDLPVHYDLDVMAPGQRPGDVTAKVLQGMAPVIEDARPDIVLVHGDTTTSFAAALAAYYARVPAAHVEAGLRTRDKYRPYPEEMNRRLAGALCDYHYAPTARARANLLAEGIEEDRILVTGNTVIDALLYAAALPCADAPIADLDESRSLILVTAHRRESFGAPFREICRALRDLADANPGIEIVYPVHPNPHVRAAAGEILEGRPRIHLIPPLEYLPFVHLLKRAWLILTDSGGIQEEAPSLGVPVLVMREVTERPEAVEAGVARLVGNRYAGILEAAQELLDAPAKRDAMAAAANPYGDGHAATRIADHLASLCANSA